MVGSGACSPAGGQKEVPVLVTPNPLLKYLSATLAFSVTKLEIAIKVGQRLMEAVLIGPVGDMMHIVECRLAIHVYSN